MRRTYCPTVVGEAPRASGDHSVVKAAFEMQAQYFTNFPHGQLWVCHVTLEKAKGATVDPRRDLMRLLSSFA
ncbi:hypothetical protein CA603_18090 [Paraburkholderia hospita]|nr:hypothetical protein CA603_18090 [Paraburkholderia hospita]